MSASRIHRTGADHWSGHSPSTDADRLRTHGPIVPMADDEPRALLPGIGLAIVLLVLAITFLIETPPAASPESPQPEAQRAHVVDAGTRGDAQP